MPVAAIGGGIALASAYGFQRWRPWAGIVFLALALASLTAVIVASWDIPVRDVRFERIQFCKSALDQIIERPFGWGAYGTLRVGEALGESARHLTAGGHIDRHAHMEILDLGVAGGIPALALAIGSTIRLIASLKPRRHESFGTGLALASGLGAWLTCWSLDNAQSELPALVIGAVWCGLILGGRAEAKVNISAPMARIKVVSYLGILAGLVLAWGLIPAATLPWSQPRSHLEWAFHQTYQADLELKFYDALVVQARTDNDLEKVREYTKFAVSRLGWIGNTEANALTTATTADDPAELLRLIASFCRHHPFHPLGLAFAQHILQFHPDLSYLISERLSRRISVWHGDMEPKPNLAIHDIEDAADAAASLNGELGLRRQPPAQTSEILENLVIRYGDLSDIGLLVLTCRAEWGESIAPWAVARAPELRWALTRQPGALLATLTQLEGKPDASANLWPILKEVFPITYTGFSEGTSAVDLNVDQDLRLMLLRFRPKN